MYRFSCKLYCGSFSFSALFPLHKLRAILIKIQKTLEIYQSVYNQSVSYLSFPLSIKLNQTIFTLLIFK